MSEGPENNSETDGLRVKSAVKAISGVMLVNEGVCINAIDHYGSTLDAGHGTFHASPTVMLGQVFKPPATAVSLNRVATSCCSAPMHASLKQERDAKVWHLSTTGNIANLTVQNTVVPPPKPSQVTVEVKAVR